MSFQVHPIAARYPMLSNEELEDLAESIASNCGLIHPIVLDGDVLIDGRNRLKACEIAGVEPTFRQFPWNGHAEGKEDAIVAYIVAENINRRHLNAGQRAILLAIAYPEPTPGKRSDLTCSNFEQVHKAALSQARAIVKWCPEYVEDILAGLLVFHKAFEEAAQRRERAAVVAEQMRRLQSEAPDLHAFVLEEKGMTAAEGIAALESRIKFAAEERAAKERREAETRSERERKEREEKAKLRQECESRTVFFQQALTVFNPRGCSAEQAATRIFSEIDLALWPAEAAKEASIECWAECAKTFAELVKVRKDKLS